MFHNTAVSAYGRAAAPASVRLMALSAMLWGVGVATIRLAAPHGLFAPAFSAVLFAATVPLAWFTVDLAVRVAGRHTPLLATATLVSMPALLLDGVAITWAPGLYGPAALPLRAEAAWLLWFVGVSLAMALWRQMRQSAPVR